MSGSVQSFAKRGLLVAVARTLQLFLCNSGEEGALHVITDLVERFILEVGQRASRYRDLSCRGRGTLRDVEKALQDLGISMEVTQFLNPSLRYAPLAHRAGRMPAESGVELASRLATLHEDEDEEDEEDDEEEKKKKEEQDDDEGLGGGGGERKRRKKKVSSRGGERREEGCPEWLPDRPPRHAWGGTEQEESRGAGSKERRERRLMVESYLARQQQQALGIETRKKREREEEGGEEGGQRHGGGVELSQEYLDQHAWREVKGQRVRVEEATGESDAEYQLRMRAERIVSGQAVE